MLGNLLQRKMERPGTHKHTVTDGGRKTDALDLTSFQNTLTWSFEDGSLFSLMYFSRKTLYLDHYPFSDWQVRASH